MSTEFSSIHTNFNSQYTQRAPELEQEILFLLQISKKK